MACDASLIFETYSDMQLEGGLQIINLELVNFRSPHLPRSFADEEVDVESVNPGDQVRIY
jgi:hexokinase